MKAALIRDASYGKTTKENQADRMIHGTDSRGTRNDRSELSEVQVLAI